MRPAVDLVNGWLEVRTDAPASFASRNIRARNNTTGSVVFVDRAVTGPLGIGGSLLNQTVTFGTLLREAGGNGTTITFSGRNGYGVSGSTTGLAAGDYRNYTLTNNSSGTVTINGNLFNHNNTTAATMAVGMLFVILTRGIDLSAYRIVQEGLTNALKHAHASDADVIVRYRPDELEIEVRDNGHGTTTSDGLGHGLVGVRERVKIYGGEMSAGKSAEGGFVLSTRLPVSGEEP